uniref:Uncharacterized protein n=1 Tax=Setaria digitata TaxID=48799 RepID=A0A915PSG4_9BILA
MGTQIYFPKKLLARVRAANTFESQFNSIKIQLPSGNLVEVEGSSEECFIRRIYHEKLTQYYKANDTNDLKGIRSKENQN